MLHTIQVLIAVGLSALAFGMAVKVDPTADLIKLMAKIGFTDALGGIRASFISDKATNYTILAASDPSGTLFTNRGAAGAVTFTLPAPSAALAQTFYDFVGVANQTFAVAAPSAVVVTFNNAAATSVTCSTAGAKIGAHIRATCDGTSWHVNGDTVGVTYTVA
jgi:hypothetical protein